MRITGRFLAALTLVAVVVSAPVAQAQKIDPGSPELLAYRLTPEAVAKLRQVMVAMDEYKPPAAGAVRSDIAIVTGLGQAGAKREAFSDAKVRETVTVLDRAHGELRESIKRAGWTSRDYVMSWMTLMTTYPAVSAKRNGRSLATGVAPDNIAFVDRHWTDVDKLMADVGDRIAKSRPSAPLTPGSQPQK